MKIDNLSSTVLQRDIGRDVTVDGDIYNLHAVVENMKDLMMTRKGEIMREPNYGSYLPDVLHELPDDSRVREIINIMYNDIELFEKNIIIDRTRSTWRLDRPNKYLAIKIIMTYVPLGATFEFSRKFSK